MKILFLSYEIPVPLDSGDRIYTAGLLRTLINNGHDLHMVTFECVKEPHTTIYHRCIDHLIGPPSRIIIVPFSPKSPVRAFFSLRPGMIANRYSLDYIHTVLRVLEHERPYDVIIVNHFKMIYLINFIRPAVEKIPIILVTQNVESLYSMSIARHHNKPVMKVAYLLDAIKMRIYERHFMRLFDAVTAISKSDCEYFLQKYNLQNTEVVTPGIDLNYQTKWPNTIRDRDVIICGSFYWEPHRYNLESFLNCSAFRKFTDRGITIKIVGGADPSFVKLINDSYPNVQMTGYVQDVRYYYYGCSISLIPDLIGGGFKLKILEAAAMKKIIIAVKGAISAPGFISNVHFLESSNLNDMVDVCIGLLKNLENGMQHCQKAYRLVHNRYSWTHNYNKLMSVIEKAKGF